MGCQIVQIPGGVRAIACSRGAKRTRKCCACSKPGVYQCDWHGGTEKTCDAYICATHALEVGDDKHLCPVHQKEYEKWKQRRQPNPA